MRRALRELARGARAHAWQASAAQASAFAHESRGVASLAGWRAGDAGARRLQPLLQQAASRRSPPALAVSLHARWNSGRAPPQPPLPEVQPAEVARLGPLDLLADAEGGRTASEVAAIAADSNFAISSLQHMVEWFHVSYDLPWCVLLCRVAPTVA